MLVLDLILQALYRIIGRAKIEFYHAEPDKCLKLNLTPSSSSNSDASLNTDPDENAERTISFPDLIRSITPPCNLNPFLFNGHLQTFYTAIKFERVPIHYRRRIFEQEDPRFPGSFTVDLVIQSSELSPDNGVSVDGDIVVKDVLPARTRFCRPDEIDEMDRGSLSEDSKPMLVALHGLSGGSYELYLRHVLANLIQEDGKGRSKWEACVLNARGCAGSRLTSSMLYNARATWDVRQTVRWLRKAFPNRPLFGIGFSLGANILTNYLGEEGENCELKAAMILSNPWNLEVGSNALQRTFLGLHLYSRVMGNNMRNLFTKHVSQMSKNPKIDLEKVKTVKYLHEFDRYVQGPTWGYLTEGAYYRDASSIDSLFAIKIPLLAVNATDDPIAVNETLPRLEAAQTPFVVLCTTSLGGHLSWFELGGGRWYAKLAEDFFNKMAFEVELQNPPGASGGNLGDESKMRDPLRPVFDATRRHWHFIDDS